MGKTTGIAWCTSTWSPFIGCTEVSPGCDHCYARVLDARHKWGGATHWGAGVPRYRTKDWTKPLRWNKQAAETGERWTVFPSLCDPFDNEVPGEWRSAFWDLIELTPSLTWLLLTKRIGNAMRLLRTHDWCAGQRNVWLGASVVNQEEADRDIPKLLAVPATRRFVSYEPALAAVDFSPWLMDGHPNLADINHPTHGDRYLRYGTPRIDQIIVGGESDQGSHKARPFNLFWAARTIQQCRAAGVPVFMKQAGSRPGWWEENNIRIWATFKDRAGADPAEWQEDLRVQETPA